MAVQIFKENMAKSKQKQENEVKWKVQNFSLSSYILSRRPNVCLLSWSFTALSTLLRSCLVSQLTYSHVIKNFY